MDVRAAWSRRRPAPPRRARDSSYGGRFRVGEGGERSQPPERLANTDLTKPNTEMVGSGPYKFLKSEFVAGSSAAYERFKDYVPRNEKPDWASGGKLASDA